MSSRVKLLAGSTIISNAHGFLVKVCFCQAETSVSCEQAVQEFEWMAPSGLADKQHQESAKVPGSILFTPLHRLDK